MVADAVLLGALGSVVGMATFYYFIHEEAMQTRQMGIYLLIRNEMWEEALIQLNSLQEQLNTALSVHNVVGEAVPAPYGSFEAYFRSVQDQIDTYRTIVLEKMKELPPVTTGTLRVLSMPSEADIFLDGEVTKLLTPETFKDVEQGMHTVRIQRYIPRIKQSLSKEVQVEVEAEKRVEIVISLKEEIEALIPVVPPITTGILRISSSPTGAKIFLDGVDTDQLTPETFKEVTPGTHTIRLTRWMPRIKETISKTEIVTIEAREEKELLIILEEA